jgi:hypothetical protein
MSFSNDQIRALLQAYIDENSNTEHSLTAFAQEHLTNFAREVMRLNDPIDAVAPQVVQELIPMAWVKCVKELRTRTGCGLREGKEAIERTLVDYLRDQLAVFESKVANHANSVESDFSINTAEFAAAYGRGPFGIGQWTFINSDGYHIKREGDYRLMTRTLPAGHYRLLP